MYGSEIMVDFLVGLLNFSKVFGKEGLAFHLKFDGLVGGHGDIN
jgi:hypothetical protein